jgi:hypothetical protein
MRHAVVAGMRGSRVGRCRVTVPKMTVAVPNMAVAVAECTVVTVANRMTGMVVSVTVSANHRECGHGHESNQPNEKQKKVHELRSKSLTVRGTLGLQSFRLISRVQ